MRAHLYFYKYMSLFMTHLSCSQPARVHAKSWFGQVPIGRKPWTGFLSCSVFSARFGWYLGLRLEFFENSFNGRSVGPMPNGEAHLWAYLAPGEVFTRQKPPWNCHFSRYSWFWSAPSHPILAQNSIFLAQKLLTLIRICHGFQSGRMDDSGAHSGPTLGKMPDGPKFFEPLEEV